MKKCMEFIKKEVVLCIAVLLAVISSCFVLPDKKYISYIDFRTMAILFCLMAVIAGFQKMGLFERIAGSLLERVNGGYKLVIILVMLCFFFSMIITNDVALITFVPLGIQVLGMMGEETREKLLVPVVVLQTIAANLGSMLTPIGNPQNLYLYERAGMDWSSFICFMFPYSAISLLLLLVCCMGVGRKTGQGKVQLVKEKKPWKKKELAGWAILFFLCLLGVAGVMHYGSILLLVVVGVFLLDRKIFCKVDYALLGTFGAFFIFVGNMGRMPGFCKAVEDVIEGNEVITAVVSSQLISNVPTALLLAGFTEEIKGLIIGTNLGGLGTLIASMASLISFRYLGEENARKRLPYLLCFTVANLLFLIVLLVFYKIVKI